MNKLLAAVVAVGVAWAGFAAEDENWVRLFNGKDFTGWHVEGGSAEFSVENGEIVGTVVTNTPGNTFLCTDKTYGDFILEVDWKLEKQPTNSGIQFRSETRPDKSTKHGTCVFGYQAEISLPKDRCGRIYDEGRRGFMNGLIWLDAFTPKARLDASAASIDHAKWNTTRIECRGYRIQTWVNGKPVVNILDDATMKGFIGLQVHAGTCPGGVRFRNIRLRDLERDSRQYRPELIEVRERLRAHLLRLHAEWESADGKRFGARKFMMSAALPLAAVEAILANQPLISWF